MTGRNGKRRRARTHNGTFAGARQGERAGRGEGDEQAPPIATREAPQFENHPSHLIFDLYTTLADL